MAQPARLKESVRVVRAEVERSKPDRGRRVGQRTGRRERTCSGMQVERRRSYGGGPAWNESDNGSGGYGRRG